MNWALYRGGSIVLRWGRGKPLRLSPAEAVRLAAALLVAAECPPIDPVDFDTSDLAES